MFRNDYDTLDGTGVRDYIHVVGSNRTYKSFRKVSEKTDVYIYNLGSGEGTSVLQLVNTFESVNKVPTPYKIVSRRLEERCNLL